MFAKNIVLCACKPVVKVKHFSATTRVSMASSLSTVGDRAFPIASARLWNSRLLHVTTAPSLSNFCSLRSHLFSLSYPNFWFFFLLFSASAVTCHFGHYNRFFYIYIFSVPYVAQPFVYTSIVSRSWTRWTMGRRSSGPSACRLVVRALCVWF